MAKPSSQFSTRLCGLIEQIYPDLDAKALSQQITAAFWPEGSGYRSRARAPGHNLWNETDTLVITYGNTLVDGQHKPLDLLRDFLNRYLRGVVKGVHILPFFPFTSDDGFAVTDYRLVNSQLGDWTDIQRIGEEFRLMSDLVLNHVSSLSTWFSEYRQGHAPYDTFFVEASPQDDLSEVVRPRTSPLLREVMTANGPKHVWCTFSHDQIDVDFHNPEVLLEFLRIMRLHIDNGVRIIRLDAVAFVWKELGTNCIHLPQTHAIVRLMRLLCDYAEERVVLMTETNVPNAENLSYFGNRNEAHMIYNFSLPPLLLHALLSGNSLHLNQWLMRMPPAQLGCAYLNFSASHDGIGVRGAEGLLSNDELDQMIQCVRDAGGLVSMRALADGSQKPYELNITYFDALKGTIEAGEDGLQVARFICSQSIVMALEGVPAFYIHSLLATHNDHAGVEKTGVNRAINRHRWDYPELRALLDDPESLNAQVLAALKDRISIRTAQKAFHPNATQFTMQLGDAFFGIWRQSPARDQSIFAINNLTNQDAEIPHISINLIEGEDWYDLLSGEKIDLSVPNIRFAPYQSRWISNLK
ncbi:MAG: sugar phosphorylase [Alphaproteobacteria bacterium]|nr:sugar phosphorylase [Alphaproteobacteria bacterium]MBU1573934.1 sugar phosphorylase [Alphaproteobacteria bacterium]MBU1827128.1 sugar phosphorylase [Alphaproteobacteria bacterium]MBU2079469.1 sugar phosphorylase [Alphaproteobacteria bacterium]MBU2161696.1 sugar phosphorylase [Alphaproteobacteria bacterium]